MIKPVSLLLIALINLSIYQTIDATNYYVSASIGNDRNPGTSPTKPWKTMNQIYTRAYGWLPGDNIYFCQGDEWMYSNLFAFSAGTASQPITWGSYQCGSSTEKPRISPAISLAKINWQQRGNMLMYSFARDAAASLYGIRAIWAGETRHLPARYPNLVNPFDATLSNESEFMWNSPATMVNRRLNSASLNQPSNYWRGATVYMRTTNWTYQQAKVLASGPGWLEVDRQPGNNLCSGFYIEQSMMDYSSSPLMAVDAPGEFVFNRTDSGLYLWPASEQIKRDILSGAIEVHFLYGNSISAMTITSNYHVVQDLDLSFTMSGISNTARTKFIARRNTIKHAVGWGVTSTNAAGSIVDSNIIEDAEADCVSLDAAGGVVSNNDLNGCGMYAGYGFSYGAASSGVVSMSANVIGNRIRNTGYSGITPHQATKITNNRLSGVMKTLNDGGGIYMFGSGGSMTTLEANTVEDVVGNYISWTPWNIASCVFTDQGTSGITIYNNTCNTAPQCMQLNSAFGNMILANQCNVPGIYLNDYSTGNAIGQHGIIGNVVVTYGTHSKLQNPVHRVKAPGRTDLRLVATFYENRYCQAGSSDTPYMFQKDFGENGVSRYNTFDDWQSAECRAIGGDCTFEQSSSWRYAGCEQVRPWDFLASSSVDELRAYGHQLLAQEKADQIKYIVGGTIGGGAVLALLIATAVMIVRRSKKQTSDCLTNLSLPTSSPSNNQSINQSFGSIDSPATGVFELVVTPEMQRSFSWSDSTIQKASQ